MNEARQTSPVLHGETPKRPAKRLEITRFRGGIDRPMLIITILLLSFGLVMVFSASYATAYRKTGNSFHYIIRQAGFAAVGLVALFVMARFDYRIYRRFTPLGFLILSGLLVLTPIIGAAQGQARRWIVIGSFTFQPSELMKFGLVFMLAWYFARYQEEVTDYSDFWRCSKYGIFIPYGIVIFVCGLIFLENHFSCMIIMFLIGTVVIFLGGGLKRWFAFAGGGGIIAAVILIMFSSYARMRLDAFLNPENYDTSNELLQTLQGLNAVGSGGLLGVGLGNSRQKHLFLPEPQNDFIFSIVCEELGFVGAMAVLVLFIMFIWRGIVIGLRAPDTFSSLVVLGLVGKVAIQVFLNMMVVTALLPNTGISLPFFSYGGTALMVQLFEVGIILSISKYSYKTD